MTKEDRVLSIFREYGIWYEYWDYGDKIALYVIRGDWHHVHKDLDFIMQKEGFKLIDEIVTESDDSDCYSSIHYYKLTQNDQGIDNRAS